MKIETPDRPWADVEAEYLAARRARPSRSWTEARARLAITCRYRPDDVELLDRLKAEMASFAAQGQTVRARGRAVA